MRAEPTPILGAASAALKPYLSPADLQVVASKREEARLAAFTRLVVGARVLLLVARAAADSKANGRDGRKKPAKLERIEIK